MRASGRMVACGVWLLAVAGGLAFGDTATPAYEADIRPLLTTFCCDCHGQTKHKGGLNLAAFTSVADIQRAGERWENVLRMLRSGEMPPKAADQPSGAQREQLTLWIDQTLDAVGALDHGARDPGAVVLHRLSRSEYNHTIRDLLGVDTHPADRFPADAGGGGGFDNNADTLYTPPLLMEKLIAAASEVLAAAKPELIFIAKPADDKPKSRRDAARLIISDFARRAYRRPVTSGDCERLLVVFDQGEKKGLAFDAAVRRALTVVLISPDFLFRVEAPGSGAQPVPLGPFEVASRLSYFLWSSMPDEELFKLAAARKLQDPQVIEQQVRRMVADPKAVALGESFAGQWLQTENLRGGAGPDPKRFPEFTDSLRLAMAREPIEYFNALVREDRSLVRLIDGDSTFVNGELARLYGMSGVDGEALREVKLDDVNRRGVLGMAGVLAVTSQSLRTSPVLRGKWVLEQILDAPPPPPPANIPALTKEEPAKGEQSLRQRLEAHRANATCAACHDRIDPLGFGLENFDPLGRWRTSDGSGRAIDASGTLISGERFAGPAELRTLLLMRKEAFVRVMIAKMLSYALGRGVGVGDRATVKEILAVLTKQNFGTRLLLAEIAKSQPFRYRRGQSVATPVAGAVAKPKEIAR